MNNQACSNNKTDHDYSNNKKGRSKKIPTLQAFIRNGTIGSNSPSPSKLKRSNLAYDNTSPSIKGKYDKFCSPSKYHTTSDNKLRLITKSSKFMKKEYDEDSMFEFNIHEERRGTKQIVKESIGLPLMEKNRMTQRKKYRNDIENNNKDSKTINGILRRRRKK